MKKPKTNKITIDDLAGMVQRGLSNIDEKVKDIQLKMSGMATKEELFEVEKRLSEKIEEQNYRMASNFGLFNESEDELHERIDELEERINILEDKLIGK